MLRSPSQPCSHFDDTAFSHSVTPIVLSPDTRKVEPAIECLEEGLKTRVKRLEVWHDLDNRHLFDKLSKDKCPGGACQLPSVVRGRSYSAYLRVDYSAVCDGVNVSIPVCVA